MTVRLLAETSPGEVRIAAVRENELLDYALWRPGAPDTVGDLYRGRVRARAPAMGGVFVALDSSEHGVHGFLPDTEGGRALNEGMTIGVRISRAAQAGKGPRLSGRLSPDEKMLIGLGGPGLVRHGPGALARLAAQYPDAAVAVDDPALAARLRPVLGDRLALEKPAFDDALASQIDALAERVLELGNGARITFDSTPALVAIDVDTGAAAGSHLAINRALVPVLARQIRLRNLSGAILIDLAGLTTRKRATLAPLFTEALADDPLRPRLLGFTTLGLAEIVRPRIYPPLHELLIGPHAAGLAALRAVAAAASRAGQSVPALRAAPEVCRALEEDKAAIADLARLTGLALILHADPSLPGNAWRLEYA